MGETAISLKNVSKSYGKREVLKNISMDIEKGCIYGLLGPSGCGKTTTVKTMAGILKVSSGEVKILGHKMPELSIMSKIGYMAQSDALYENLSAYDNLYFFGTLYGIKKDVLKNKIKDVLKLTNLEEFAKKKVSSFSGGMKKRLSLSIALISDPEILILDEPTVGIDPMLRKDIWDEFYRLSENGMTILVTTHVMDEAEKCGVLAMMREGEIIASGTPEEIIKKSGKNNIEDAFIFYGKSGE